MTALVLRRLAGAAVSMAIVRDRFCGMAASQQHSRLMPVMGIAPILAPNLGGFVLAATTWRGIFVVLAVAAFMLIWVAVLGRQETSPGQASPDGPAGLGEALRPALGAESAVVGTVTTAAVMVAWSGIRG